MEQNEVILGVDTHLDAHVGAVISDTGRLLGTLSVSTDTAGYLDLLARANSFGQLRRAGVEGTGTYGAGLARVLRDHEIEVLEVNRPDRAMRRSRGKSDPTDAENAARAVLSGRATAFQRNSAGPPRRCALYPLPGAVPSRPGRRLSISYGVCSLARPRKSAIAF
jgi:transposase